MSAYSHIQAFNPYGNEAELDKKVKTFQDFGWDFIGATPIIGTPFISVGWLMDKGDPIYPPKYPKKE